MSIAGRTALRATRALRAAGPNAGAISASGEAARERVKDQTFKKGASRDPELYVSLRPRPLPYSVASAEPPRVQHKQQPRSPTTKPSSHLFKPFHLLAEYTNKHAR